MRKGHQEKARRSRLQAAWLVKLVRPPLEHLKLQAPPQNPEFLHVGLKVQHPDCLLLGGELVRQKVHLDSQRRGYLPRSRRGSQRQPCMLNHRQGSLQLAVAEVGAVEAVEESHPAGQILEHENCVMPYMN